MNRTMNIFTSTLALGLTTTSGMAGVNQTMNQALDRGQDSPIAYIYQTSTAEEEGTGLATDAETSSLVLHAVTPRYPEKALRESIEGWVELLIKVDEQGLVADIDVVKANPPRIFEKAAVESVNQWRFQPKMVAGQAVPYEYRQTIDFELINYILVDGEIVAEQ